MPLPVDTYSPLQVDANNHFLARYRRPVHGPLAESYVSALSSPGELVLDPFAQDDAVLRAALGAGRPAIALTSNPLLALLTRFEAAPPPAAGLKNAVDQLAAAPKVDLPLAEHLQRLYLTRCTGCGARVVASAFIWKREAPQSVRGRRRTAPPDNLAGRPEDAEYQEPSEEPAGPSPEAPFAREYACPHCGHRGLREPLPEDERESGHPPTPTAFQRGLIAARLSPDPARHALHERLLDLFTPRNLYALATLLVKIELLFAGSPLLEALRVALLQALDVGSALNQVTPEGWRPLRSLRRSPMWREANVWQAFAQAFDVLERRAQEPRLPLAGALPEALAAPTPQAYVALGPLGKLAPHLAGRVRLALCQLPRFDPTFAVLSYFWSGWLWGRESALAAEHLLRQRSGEEDRYQRALQAALGAVRGTLAAPGQIGVFFQSPTSRHLEELLTAARAVGLRVTHEWHGTLDEQTSFLEGGQRAEHHVVLGTQERGA